MIEKSATSRAAGWQSGLRDLNHTRSIKLASVLQIAKFVPTLPHTETNFAIRTLAMAKPSKTAHVCQNCGAVSPRWAGKCPSCGEWNTLTEETDAIAPPGSGLARKSGGRVVVLESLKGR